MYISKKVRVDTISTKAGFAIALPLHKSVMF